MHICVIMSTFHTSNLLGAVAVAAMDAIESVTKSVTGHGGETAAALVAIGHAPGLTIEELRRVLRLSHPGTVRVVDRLVEAGLAERRDGVDRRAIALHITSAGAATRTSMLQRREAVLDELLAPLDVAERAQLAGLLARMLEQRPDGRLQGLSICRLCDDGRCRNCPVDAGVDRVARGS